MPSKSIALGMILLASLLRADKPSPQPAGSRPVGTVRPPKIMQATAGKQIVAGFVSRGDLTVRVSIYTPETKLVARQDVIPNADQRTFVAGFPEELVEGWIVIASHVSNGKVVQDSESEPVTVAAAKKASASTTSSAAAEPAARHEPPKAEPAKEEPVKKWGECEPGGAETGLASPTVNPRSGATKLSGAAILDKGKVTVCVARRLVAVAAAADETPVYSTDGAAFSGGKYAVKLKDKLLQNQEILVIVASDDGKRRLSGAGIVAVGEVTGVSVKIPDSIEVGQNSIAVTATPTPPDAPYEIRVRPCATTGLNLKTSDAKPYVVTGENGNAVLTFELPFYEGQTIRVCQEAIDKGAGGVLPILLPKPPASGTAYQSNTGKASVPEYQAFTETKSKEATVSDPGDLGRFRYYFTSGIVLSSNRGFATQSSGTQAGLFLGLTADRAWLPGNVDGWRRWNINTYFDARLTQVATQGSGMEGSDKAGTSTPLQSFSQSKKAANLQVGGYMPITSSMWERGPKKELYSIFAGPVAKAGFTTLTDSSDSTETTPSDPSAAQQVSGRFFTNYSYGGRLGVFRHRKDRNSAPELVHWVDVTLGRFGGFQAFRDARLQQPLLYTPENLAISTPQFLTLRPWRWQFEGVLKVPHTPFVLGFNANVGRGAVAPFIDVNDCKSGDCKKYHYAQPRDDLRFLFGAQFDFSKFLKLLPQLQ